ncbi:MAG: AI-2E family transporter [Acutalibacter sp.]|jgi:predicted PurR-regulated permease PerM|uniref:AI-2E family transporter n=1 Tax=Acutalibacter sp. TaxID=1918636 RepID=UPI002172D506|nr:AI-2E family transporter [Acutalibacter sp.]MCI9224410.1 AI-2E family transporter [Acutalibacter sp.]
MYFRDEKSRDWLKVGSILLILAALLAMAVLRFDQVWGALRTLGNTLSPVLGGLVIAYILNVFVHFFEDIAFKPFEKTKSKIWDKLRRPVSVTLAYLVVILLVVFIVCFIIPSLVDSMSVLTVTIQHNLPIYANQVMAWANDMAREHDLTFVQEFLKDFNWSSLLNMLGDATKFTTEILSQLFNVTANLASGVFAMIMGFIFSVYMLSGKEKLIRGTKDALRAFLPKRASTVIARVARLSNQVFFSFIQGQLTECVILGVLCYIGMSILRLDYALLISSVVALGALIPILGAYIGAGVGAFILLLVHPLDALIFVVFLVILQQLEGNLIYPRVVGSSIGLPPIWTIFAVTFWGGVLGIPGIWIGTPLTAVVYRLFREQVYKRLHRPKLERGEY